MLVDLYTKEGNIEGQVELSDEVFAIEPNEHAMHQAVIVYLAHQRQGTAKTKTRAEVSGGGKKPWRQKGRGTARSGSSRSPVWVGGGTLHGPKPHEFNIKLPKKVKRLAKKSAFSLRCSESNLMVVNDFTFSEIKTKQMADVLKNLKLENQKTLVLVPGEDSNVFMSGRNIENIYICPADKISAYDILSYKKLLVFKGAIEVIENAIKN